MFLFSWLDSSFLFSTEQQSVVWTYVSRFIHSPAEDISVASKFSQLQRKLVNTCVCSCVGGSFQLLWVNAKEGDCWAARQGRAALRKKPPDGLPESPSRLVLLPAARKSPCSSTASPAFAVRCSGSGPL